MEKHVVNQHPQNQTSLSHLIKTSATELPKGQLDDIIVRLVVNNYLPFKLVDSPEFRALLVFLDPDVKQMSRRVLMRKLESTVDMYKTSKYSDLKKTSSMISLRTDIWTASNRKPFSAVTAHYIDSESSLQSDLIAFVRLPFPHSGEHLAACLEDIIETSGIGEKVSCVTTDNASNNVKALQLMMSNTRLSYSRNLVHIRCLSHVFNLVVRDAMTGLNDDISAVRTLLNFLRHPKQDQLLSETARRLNEVYVKPLVDVETRWNSIYDMLQRALKLKPCISHLVRHHKDYSELGIADLSWRGVEDVCSFFKRFYEATVLLSGSTYPTLSMVIPVYEDLLKHCEVSLLEPCLRCFAETAREGLLRHRGALYCQSALLAAFLDPRFRTRHATDVSTDIFDIAKREYGDVQETSNTLVNL